MTIISPETKEVNPPAPAEPCTVKTVISQVHPNRILTRGHNLITLAEHYLFGHVVFEVFSVDSPM